jgi:hypothetical protein
VIRVVTDALAYNKFPAFCATLLGSYTLIEVGLYILLKKWLRSVLQSFANNRNLLLQCCRVTAGLTASSLSFRMLNSQTSSDAFAPEPELTPGKITPGYAKSPIKSDDQQAGGTLDFTLLVSVRALEALTREVWARHCNPSRTKPRHKLESLLGQSADSSLFIISAGIVMWAWFYHPNRLPRAYRKWIGEAAQVDERLVTALRNAKNGNFIYGKDTGQAPILQSMCKDYNWPLLWGDPAVTIPVPCEMVHMGTGPSCHWHAFSRFFRAFKFSLAMYLPFQLLVKMRHPSFKALESSIREAAQSSAFLGTFVGLFYYFVCLSRTQLGPRIFSQKVITRQMWDSGLCVGAGCVACGWSVLLEKAKRRSELALFVAPRAAAVFLPRRYDKKVS